LFRYLLFRYLLFRYLLFRYRRCVRGLMPPKPMQKPTPYARIRMRYRVVMNTLHCCLDTGHGGALPTLHHPMG